MNKTSKIIIAVIIISLALSAFMLSSYLEKRTPKQNSETLSTSEVDTSFNSETKPKAGAKPKIGAKIDELDGVAVYYNGSISNISGRNIAPDGYNLGQKFQCVEFVKRYYYQALKHKMPNVWGNAQDFFNPKLKDGNFNKERGLTQYRNKSKSKPQKGDLFIFSSWRYGHVAIVAKVNDKKLEIIQQNPGEDKPSREEFSLLYNPKDKVWTVSGGRTVLGWLRKN